MAAAVDEPVELCVPKYSDWRSNLENWKDRAKQRVASSQQLELNFKHLQRRRDEAEERRELEERRRKESALRAEQRLREAAEYSKWRSDAVLKRRAEEKLRCADHSLWREHVSKLRQGVLADSAKCQIVSSPREILMQQRHSSDRPCSNGARGYESLPRPPHVCCSQLNELAAPVPSSPVVSPAQLAVSPAQHDRTGNSTHSDTTRTRTWWPLEECDTPLSSPLSSSAQRQLAEEDIWQATVARNREALVAQRREKQKEAVEAKLSAYRARMIQMR